MPHHRRFTYFRRTKAFSDALHAAPPRVADAVEETLRKFTTGQNPEPLPYWGDSRLGDNAWTLALPDCDAFILYREFMDQAVLQLVQLVWLDD